jgi:G3E family GTPase
MTISRRAEQRGRGPPDHVILETTGLADPAPVAFTFLSNPWVAARFVVDAIM